jgi:hypothetical protein
MAVPKKKVSKSRRLQKSIIKNENFIYNLISVNSNLKVMENKFFFNNMKKNDSFNINKVKSLIKYNFEIPKLLLGEREVLNVSRENNLKEKKVESNISTNKTLIKSFNCYAINKISLKFFKLLHS